MSNSWNKLTENFELAHQPTWMVEILPQHNEQRLSDTEEQMEFHVKYFLCGKVHQSRWPSFCQRCHQSQSEDSQLKPDRHILWEKGLMTSGFLRVCVCVCVCARVRVHVYVKVVCVCVCAVYIYVCVCVGGGGVHICVCVGGWVVHAFACVCRAGGYVFVCVCSVFVCMCVCVCVSCVCSVV